MAKNKRFEHEYKIVIKGTTTNDSASDLFYTVMNAIIEGWNMRTKTVQASLERKIIK